MTDVAIMSKLSISALEEQWDLLERLHSDFVQFWAAQPQVGDDRFSIHDVRIKMYGFLHQFTGEIVFDFYGGILDSLSLA